MAAATVLKIEHEAETCCVCGNVGELLSPEEYDAASAPTQSPLRTMLLHLNNNKVVPEGRFCTACIRRALEAYEFSNSLSSKAAPPLSEKIRALRRRLHELTQKIDVFIVVGGPATNAGANYSEDDIIMVEKDVLAAATAADDEDLERARNARGDTVYQCSVCPQSFQRVAEYRVHVGSHPADATHSCWTCGAQYRTRDALRDHAAAHHHRAPLVCHLCSTTFQSESELRAHAGGCAGACPACGEWAGGGSALRAHVLSAHAQSAPCVCAWCFLTLESPAALAAHMLRHRQARQYVCGYDGCILRFTTRGNLMSHIRKCHALASSPGPAPAPSPAPAAPVCDDCGRTFATVAAMKRHARVHKRDTQREQVDECQMEEDGGLEVGDVEYLEVEALDDSDAQD